jgi:C1A family cysteine protease
MTKNVYGWHPDLHDQRDLKFSNVRKAVSLPDSVDLRKYCSAVEDQGDLGSCTANAGVGLLEFLDKKPDSVYTNLSRLFLYYNTRLIEGTVRYDSGCTIRGTMKSIFKYGVCAESKWPYKILKYKTKPTASSYTEGKKRTISGYYSMRTLGDIKASIAEGMPVLFGFTVYENFESDEVARTGILDMPGVNDTVLGGHAILAVGYDDKTQRLIVRNSYGNTWGDNGYFYMPYEYVTSKIASDFWTIR